MLKARVLCSGPCHISLRLAARLLTRGDFWKAYVPGKTTFDIRMKDATSFRNATVMSSRYMYII